MSRVFFSSELEGVTTFWRIQRRDGVTLGFTAHDRNLWFDGVLHRSAPGMVPSAIRRTADLAADGVDVQGALSHDAIAAADLASGRFDGARILIGVVDWETLDRTVLYNGSLGSIAEEAGSFTAELRSSKAGLEEDPVPRTSPTCRARFCGPGCTLPADRYTHEAQASAIDLDANAVLFDTDVTAAAMHDGQVRWLDGPQAGVTMNVVSAGSTGLVLDIALDASLDAGARALLREGCDHTIATCGDRFANAINFQGEPTLPGNDLLARYGQVAK